MSLSEKSMTFERLDDHFKRARQIAFDPRRDRIVLVSDAHKWDRGATDFFNPVEPVYLAALDHYYAGGFTLVLLGDIEEGDGDILRHVLGRYPETFVRERRFLPDRYLRVYGNHDHDWKQNGIRRWLDEAMGVAVPVCPALRFGEEIFVVHGHEGDLFSDELHGFTQVLLRLFKRLFEKLGGKKPSTADNPQRRTRRAELLYEWGRERRQIVIAGHTHLAYFASVSLTRLLGRRIRLLQVASATSADPALAAVQARQLELERRALQHHDPFHELDEGLPDSALPLYFNTGCCRYSNGMTAIEIADGAISLVRWIPEREVLETRRLEEIRPVAG